MQPSQQHSRINLADLKAQIVKKLGPERSKLYFHYLNGLLSLKLSKGEFDKLCYRTLGRENLPLHNQLIRSILKNVCHSKVPPSVNEKEVRKPAVAAGKKSPPREDGYTQTGLQPTPTPTPSRTPVIWSNGDVPANAPRKGMSGIRERKLKDRSSLLGLNVKVDFPLQQFTYPDESIKVVMENGDLHPCDFQRPVHRHQGLAEQPKNEQEVLLQRPIKKPKIKRSQDDSVSVHSKGQLEVVVVEDGEEVEQVNISSSTRGPLTAPLGIPFCSASIGGARRALPAPNSSFASYYDSGELSDSDTLRKRMEQIAGTQGLEGVSTDTANLLNNGLDAYLKRLIRSCIELVGARSGHEPSVQSAYKQHPQGKVINGIWPGNQSQMQSSCGPLAGTQEQKSCCPVSLLDFKVAMELNPQQLGEDWPLVLEKICMHSVEE